PIDLTAMVAVVLAEWQETAEQKFLTLQAHVPPDLPPLLSDPLLVRLILVNLIGNALKYTQHGSVTVTLSLGDMGRHVMAISDTGQGIAEPHLTEIFEPFMQVEPIMQKHAAGVGLGLALVKQMVQALAGRIVVDSELGKGSTFQVVLPPGQPITAGEPAEPDMLQCLPANFMGTDAGG
ncbi:MAG: hypothetical protein H7338_04240, partial [Candidatus Sericytochromatia bacterium]|nr:hypothetical protein [Candidatus Sericytochromatia bacterium]